MGAKRSYKFGPFHLDPKERRLLRHDQPVSLTPKCFDLLVAFVENEGHLLGKDELLERLWPGQFVEETNLSFNVSSSVPYSPPLLFSFVLKRLAMLFSFYVILTITIWF